MKHIGKKLLTAAAVAVLVICLALLAVACAGDKAVTKVTVDLGGGTYNGEAALTLETDPQADLTDLLGKNVEGGGHYSLWVRICGLGRPGKA